VLQQRIDPVAGFLGCPSETVHQLLVRVAAGLDGIQADSPPEQVRETFAVKPLHAFPRVEPHGRADRVAREPALEEA
jgi:hypothetical protein